MFLRSGNWTVLKFEWREGLINLSKNARNGININSF